VTCCDKGAVSYSYRLLLGNKGMYMIHSSRGGDIKKALSVSTGDKVKHFLIFYNRVSIFFLDSVMFQRLTKQ
jgi:hypothetical protein